MQNLFRPPSGAAFGDLTAVMLAILAATPLSAPHTKELPFAVRDLSRLLTRDRSQISSSYWVNKRLLTAYCRYFLPWNLLRLSWLLPSLNLPIPKDGVILDLGSGPLTVPLALWLAKPALRSLPLTIICADVSPAPMNLGREIFQRLAPDSPWTIELVRGPMDKILRELSRPVNLVTAANVFNEIKPSREVPLQQRVASLLRRIATRLAPQGALLAIEPGTRLGGKLTATIRQAGFGVHLVPEVPCPHWGPCPMLAERATGWCHFSHIVGSAPLELMELTRKAGLEKDTLSLSCMLLRRAEGAEIERARKHLPAQDDFDDDLFDDLDDDEENEIHDWAKAYAASGPQTSAKATPNVARILSDPIRLPDRDAPARYGCSSRGLVLVHNALRVPSGAIVTVIWPQKPQRDAKSGACIATLEEAPAPKNPRAQPRQPKTEQPNRRRSKPAGSPPSGNPRKRER